MSYQTIISVDDLKINLANNNWVIFDCRFSLKNPNKGREMFNQGHILGAQFADMDTDLASPKTETSGRHPLPNPDSLIEKLRRWGVNNDSQVICYDDISGAFAARMWWLMRWLGHEDVAVLDGGIEKWAAKNQPIETDARTKVAGNFSGTANNKLWVDVEYVQQELIQGKIKLLDARTPERFTATDKKTDPVPGHIPGAKNLPFSGNLNKQGLFLSSEELHARFAPLSSHPSDAQVICMCGSGVTACHNLLAMSIAGLPEARLYVGSWSQWIKDKSRPVAVGEA